jgi:hypothetical protein
MEEDVLAAREREGVVLADVERRVAAMHERRDDRDVLGEVGERKVPGREEREHGRQRDDPEDATLGDVVQGWGALEVP